jgi:hypothetical protein
MGLEWPAAAAAVGVTNQSRSLRSLSSLEASETVLEITNSRLADLAASPRQPGYKRNRDALTTRSVVST